MAKHQNKIRAALSYRVAEFERRGDYGRQVSGGDKIVKMMHRPGSQNRRKGYGA